MIIYGHKATHLQTSALTNYTCPSCGTQGSVIMSLYNRHFHVFWIPMFPIGKIGISQCSHCKQTLKKNEMPLELSNNLRIMKETNRVPIWSFSGLFIIAAFVLYYNTIGKTNREKEHEVLVAKVENMKTDIKVNDIFKYYVGDEYDGEKGSFTTLIKIKDVRNDSVFFSYSNFIAKNQNMFAYEEKLKDDAFAEEITALTKSEFNNLKIIDGLRK